MQRHWSRLLEQLVLIRLGQELGTDSELAQAIASSIDFVSCAIKSLVTN